MTLRTCVAVDKTETKNWRAAFRVLLGFVLLYAIIWMIRLIMGVGPNLLLRWLEATPNVRAYIGSTLNYSVGIASYIVFPALALRQVLDLNPWPVFFPFRNGWWRDLLFGFLLVTLILLAFFLVEVRAGWLIIDSWNWQTLPIDALLRTIWVGWLVNVGVAIGEETVFRGYLLTGLKTTLGKWRGLVVMMVVFGLFHLPAYIENGLDSWTLTLAILLATLFGALFGLTYLRTGTLWLPVILHFAWNFVENDVFNLTADSTNPNLIGALTRLHSPLTTTEVGLGNVVILETLAFGLITLGTGLWLKRRSVKDLQLHG